MTTHAETVELMPDISSHRAALRRAALTMLPPLIVYAVATQFVRSSALALGIAGGVAVAYSIVLAVAQRRIDPIALLSAIAFSLACVVSVLAGGSSLPLKLQEAAITFSLGLLMLIAVLVDRLASGRLGHARGRGPGAFGLPAPLAPRVACRRGSGQIGLHHG